MARRRLDVELVRRNLARSREHAQQLIAQRRVRVAGNTATKSSTQVDEAAALVVVEASVGPDYVSRGAHKLVGALDAFTDIRVDGARCLDAGASTGGFTDVLLRRGADRVVCVDVGCRDLVVYVFCCPQVFTFHRVTSCLLVSHLFTPVRVAWDQEDSPLFLLLMSFYEARVMLD